MNKTELKAKLDEKGISYNDADTNKQLEDLLKDTVVASLQETTKNTSAETKIVEPIKVVLKNTSGEEVKAEDYFFEGVVLPSFEGTCGKPVDREDLLEVFNKVFRPEDNILFYRQPDKEVYLIIVPIKYSTTIGENNNSITGDFQKHAISFLKEGQVNLDSLRKKLEMIKTFVKYTDR